MNKINYELIGKQVKVTTIYNTEIQGIFEEDFEDEKEIAINNVLIKYDEIKEIIKL